MHCRTTGRIALLSVARPASVSLSRDLDLPSPRNPVCARGRELGADQAVEQLSLAAMQQNERLGVALRAAGEGAVVLAIERH